MTASPACQKGALAGFRWPRQASQWAPRLTVFTAGYGSSHRLGFVQPHSLEFCVCENGSVSGEKQRRFIVPVRATLINE